MSFDSGFIDRVKDSAQADLPELVEAAGYRPTRIARRYHCAFCADKTPSAWLYPDRIHSFCCQKTHDAIGLEQLAAGGQPSDAIRRLAARYGLVADSVSAACRPRIPQEEIALAVLARTGLEWRLERALAVAKAELHGPRHEEAAVATRALTGHLAWLQSWSPWNSAVITKRMDATLIRACVDEALEAQLELASIFVALGQKALAA
jgi:hypothetical protein